MGAELVGVAFPFWLSPTADRPGIFDMRSSSSSSLCSLSIAVKFPASFMYVFMRLPVCTCGYLLPEKLQMTKMMREEKQYWASQKPKAESQPLFCKLASMSMLRMAAVTHLDTTRLIASVGWTWPSKSDKRRGGW